MTDLEKRVVSLEESQAAILSHVRSIDASLNKYKGFVGAIWFVVSCIGIFFSAFKFFHR